MHLPRQMLILLSKWLSGGPPRLTDSPARPLATRRLPPARPPAHCLPPAPPACLTREPKVSIGTQKETQGHSNEHRNTYVPRHCPGTYLEWGIKTHMYRDTVPVHIWSGPSKWRVLGSKPKVVQMSTETHMYRDTIAVHI